MFADDGHEEAEIVGCRLGGRTPLHSRSGYESRRVHRFEWRRKVDDMHVRCAAIGHCGRSGVAHPFLVDTRARRYVSFNGRYEQTNVNR